MSKYQINPISKIFYKVAGTGVILILAVLIDWWLFKLFSNHVRIIYFLGVVSFASIFAGFIVNIWKGFNQNSDS